MTNNNAALSYQKMGQAFRSYKKPEQLDNSANENIKSDAQEKKENPYLVNAVMTASKERLTLMLYDGAIRFMTQAISSIENKDIEKANESCKKAQNIFSELMSSLNMKYEMSKTLYNLYAFVKESIINANIKKDTNLLKEMIDLTKEFKDTWAEAMKIANKA